MCVCVCVTVYVSCFSTLNICVHATQQGLPSTHPPTTTLINVLLTRTSSHIYYYVAEKSFMYNNLIIPLLHIKYIILKENINFHKFIIKLSSCELY